MAKNVIFLAATTLIMAGCATSGPPVDTAGVRVAIDRSNAQMAAAMNSGRIDDLRDLYDPNAIVLAPNAPPFMGHTAIHGFWTAVAGMKMRDVTLTTTELEVHDDIAIETGNYTMTLNPPGAPGAITDRGKYLVVWKRQADGSWKLYRDMFNTSLPM